MVVSIVISLCLNLASLILVRRVSQQRRKLVGKCRTLLRFQTRSLRNPLSQIDSHHLCSATSRDRSDCESFLNYKRSLSFRSCSPWLRGPRTFSPSFCTLSLSSVTASLFVIPGFCSPSANQFVTVFFKSSDPHRHLQVYLFWKQESVDSDIFHSDLVYCWHIMFFLLNVNPKTTFNRTSLSVINTHKPWNRSIKCYINFFRWLHLCVFSGGAAG